MPTTIVLPRIMQIGKGASLELPQVLRTLGCRYPLIVTDKMMVKLGYAETLQTALSSSGIESQIFDDTVPEPTVSSILAGVDMARSNPFDCLVALGGGSPIDSAKAIAILARHGGVMRDYMVPRVVHESGIPVVAIPTTAGTGSEATRVTVITDDSNDEKMLCMGMGFMPVAALVDYNLSISAPPRTTADTGIDALTHAIEAYVSKKANLYTDAQALEAMHLLAPNLRRVYQNGKDAEAREAMMLGATLAGVAFSNASVALVHGMSRPIGANFHVPHGLSNAMLLPSITAFSLPAASARYADCARAMRVAEATDTDAVANEKLLIELRALNEELQVPTPAQFGIDKDRWFGLLDTMAEQAIASGSPANNPRVPSKDEVIALYREVWV